MGLSFSTNYEIIHRFLPVRNYIIFYRVTETSIFIDRILYKRRDYLPLLGLQ